VGARDLWKLWKQLAKQLEEHLAQVWNTGSGLSMDAGSGSGMYTSSGSAEEARESQLEPCFLQERLPVGFARASSCWDR